MPWIPWLTEISSGKFKILGKGDKKATFTHPDDIAGFTAYVITHLPPPQLANKIFRIEGEAASLLDISKLYASKVGVEYVGEFTGDEGEFRNFLHGVIESGKGLVAYDLASKDAAELSNHVWEGHQWKGIKESLGL